MTRVLRYLKYLVTGIALLAMLFMLVGLVVHYVYQMHSEDMNKINSPDGIESLEQVTLGGIPQWIYVRAEHKNKPVLLFLHGGPGSPEMPFATKKFQGKLEKDFVVVHWDQRGAGKSYTSNLSDKAFTLDDYVSDTVELTRYLANRFNKKKIVLVGHSWGSALGMVTVSRFPGYYYAYVGIGQVASMDQGEKLSYQWVLDEARRRGESENVARLESIGMPPYKQFADLGFERSLVNQYGGGIHNESNPMLLMGRYYFQFHGYSTLDFLYHFPAGAYHTLTTAWGWVGNIDLFKDAPKVEVPIYFCIGRHDMTVPSQLSYQYFQTLQAPKKEFVWFENSAHSPNFEEPDKFYGVMVGQVLKSVHE